MIQTIVTHECPTCGSLHLVKNEHDYKRSQKYHCKACHRYGTLHAQRGHDQRTRTQVSLRGIEWIFGVSRPTLADWLASWSHHLPPLADTLSAACWGDVLELDELWSFVLKKANQRWIWVALCRRTRQIVAYFIGDRSATSCLHLWRRIPCAYVRCCTFSDFWDAYRHVFDPKRHRAVGKDSGQTSHVGRWFNTLRQHLARFVRETLSFSKSDRFHEWAFRLFVQHYNSTCIS